MIKVLVAYASGATALQAGAAPIRSAMRNMHRAAPSMSSLYDFSAVDLDGKDQAMSDYKGKPVVILNVASL